MICNAAGYSDQTVAELIIGFAVDALRNVARANEIVRMGGTSAGIGGRKMYVNYDKKALKGEKQIRLRQEDCQRQVSYERAAISYRRLFDFMRRPLCAQEWIRAYLQARQELQRAW